MIVSQSLIAQNGIQFSLKGTQKMMTNWKNICPNPITKTLKCNNIPWIHNNMLKCFDLDRASYDQFNGTA